MDPKCLSSFVVGLALLLGIPSPREPLVGTQITLSTPSSASQPDVAYDASNDLYLVVWGTSTPLGFLPPSSRVEIVGQRVNGDSTLNGPAVILDSGLVPAIASSPTPKVASIAAQDAFVIVWSDLFGAGSILARTVLAGSGALSSTVTVASGPDVHGRPDVGGEATNAASNAIVVWKNETRDEILARQVSVNGTTLTPGSAILPVALDGVPPSAWANGTPAISKSGGSTGHHLIAWERQHAATGDFEIHAALVDRALTFLDNAIEITPPVANDHEDWGPDVDGDGRSWLVAWSRSESPAGMPVHDIACRAVAWNPAAPLPDQAYAASPIAHAAGLPGTNDTLPSVAWVGGSVLLSHREGLATSLRSVDPFRCTPCEGPFAPFTVGLVLAAVASKQGGGATVDIGDALVAQSASAVASGFVTAHRFRADHGRVLGLGRGCGIGGVPLAPCARVGNAGFAVQLRSAAPSTSIFLVIGSRSIGRRCGPCTLIPDPWTGFVFGGMTTDSRGDAVQVIPIPNSQTLAGIGFYAQWLVASGAAGCPGFDLSDALQITIQ